MTTTSEIGRDEAPGTQEGTKEVWRPGLQALGAAAAANLLIFGIGLATGLDYAVQTQADAPTMDVTAVLVLASSVVPMLIGLGVAHLVRRRGPRALQVLQIAGAVVAVASLAMPLSASGETATRLTLAAMHLVVGVIWIATLARVRRG